MVFYPDNRGKFQGKPQWDIQPGQGRADNPKTVPESKSTIAQRDPVQNSSTGSRQHVRITTTEDSALLQSQAEAEALAQRQAEEAARAQPSAMLAEGEPSYPPSEIPFDLGDVDAESCF